MYRRILKYIDAHRPFAAALVLESEGSTPQKTGTRAVIFETGEMEGTIGGGAVEAEARRRAVEACKTGRPVVFEMKFHGDEVEKTTGLCGGAMRVLLDPTAAKDRAAYAQAAAALEGRERGVLLTTVRTVQGAPSSSRSLLPGGTLHLRTGSPSSSEGPSALETESSSARRTYTSASEPIETVVQWVAEDSISADIRFPGAEAIRLSLARETSAFFLENSSTPESSIAVLVEPVIPQPVLLIAGGGHIGQALARQAAALGFDVTVIDDRPEFADPALFPDGVVARCGDISQAIANSPIDKDTYIVLVTRDHQHDAQALQACIRAPAAYVGMIGSARKVAKIREHFLATGLATEEEFNRVHAPVGLDIGAITVPEIATSIAAELIAVRRKGARRSTPNGEAAR